MAAVDGLSLREPRGRGDFGRWAVAGAFALALHAALFVYLNRSPEPVGFESQVPLELDLMPPPSGEAQTEESGANSAASVAADDAPEVTPDEVQDQPTEVEELQEIDDTEVAPPPPDSETIAAEAPDEMTPVETPDEATPVERTEVAEREIPPDLLAPPPDVEPAVTLPPEDTVVAREEQIEPPKPAPKPVARKPEPKREITRETPRRDVTRETPRAAPRRTQAEKPAERPAPARTASQAGGRGGASANAGAARAAASAYGARVRAAVASQKPANPGFSGRATVSFTVTRSGAVTGVSASGGGPVAAAAAAMVRRASIPPMPAEMTGGSARYTLPISFTSR